MKKILALIVLATGFITAGAQTMPPYLKPQTQTLSPRMLTGTDTLAITIPNIGSNVKSFGITVIKDSGTVAGKAWLYATNDGIRWEALDSIALSDKPLQGKTTLITHTSYATYEAYIIVSGCNVTPYWTVVRRPDESY